jgi:hypothetical protein
MNKDSVDLFHMNTRRTETQADRFMMNPRIARSRLAAQ